MGWLSGWKERRRKRREWEADLQRARDFAQRLRTLHNSPDYFAQAMEASRARNERIDEAFRRSVEQRVKDAEAGTSPATDEIEDQ